MGINRRTVIRYAANGQITEDEQGRVLLSEVQTVWSSPVTGEVWGKDYGFSRASSRPGGEAEADRKHQAFRAPTTDVDQAATMGGGSNGGVDFHHLKEIYYGLRVIGDELMARIRTRPGGRVDGLTERLDVVGKRVKFLRAIARRRVLEKPISPSDEAKTKKILKHWHAGLALFATGFYRAPARAEGLVEEAQEELAEMIDWPARVGSGLVDFSELDPMSPFRAFREDVKLASNTACLELVVFYWMNLHWGRDRSSCVPPFRTWAKRMGITPGAANKRVLAGIDLISKTNPKLADELEKFRRSYKDGTKQEEPEQLLEKAAAELKKPRKNVRRGRANAGPAEVDRFATGFGKHKVEDSFEYPEFPGPE